MTYTINSNSNLLIQSSSPNYVDLSTNTILESSLVTYTPVSSSSKIIYDYSFIVHYYQTNADIGYAKLQEYDGSNWVDVTNCIRSFGTTQQIASLVNIKFIIDSWSGSKQLRLYCGSYNSFTLYANRYWGNGNSNYYNKFKCNLKVSEI